MEKKRELLYLKKAYEAMKVLNQEGLSVPDKFFKDFEKALESQYQSLYKQIDDSNLFVLIEKDLTNQYYIADTITKDFMSKDNKYYSCDDLEYVWYENESCLDMEMPEEITLIQVDPFTEKEIQKTNLKLRDKRER